MAAAYDGGVVLGADSRTSTGNYVVCIPAVNDCFWLLPMILQTEGIAFQLRLRSLQANRVTDKLTPLTDKVSLFPGS